MLFVLILVTGCWYERRGGMDEGNPATIKNTTGKRFLKIVIIVVVDVVHISACSGLYDNRPAKI